MCNYTGAACKTEIMKVKKKTLTQFLALGFQGQTPDWALREDGGDEWDEDANVVRFSVGTRLLSLQKSSSVCTCCGFYFTRLTKSHSSLHCMSEHNAHKIPRGPIPQLESKLRNCMMYSYSIAQLLSSSAFFFFITIIANSAELKAPVCKINCH